MSVSNETERKFIIRRPGEAFLGALPHTEIIQTYLIPEKKGTTDRVRKRGLNGEFAFTHTKKERISPLTSIEDETEITEEEYLSLLSRQNPELVPIEKTRYLVKSREYTFEIDVYPFWKKQAIMEVELADEDASYVIPDGVEVIREVTGNRAYSNAAFAKNFPDEDE